MRVGAHESSAIWESPLLFYYFRYVAQPTTRENHVLELRHARLDNRSVRVLYDAAAMSQVQTTFACHALRNRLRQISARWDRFFLHQLIERFCHYISTNSFLCANKLVYTGGQNCGNTFVFQFCDHCGCKFVYLFNVVFLLLRCYAFFVCL